MLSIGLLIENNAADRIGVEFLLSLIDGMAVFGFEVSRFESVGDFLAIFFKAIELRVSRICILAQRCCSLASMTFRV